MEPLALLPTAGLLPVTPSLAHRPAYPLLSSAKATSLFPRLATKRRTAVSPRASSSPLPPPLSSLTAATLSPSPPPTSPCTRWVVVMEKPPNAAPSKSEVIDYYVETLATVLGSEKEAQMCIYDFSWQNQFGFCCDIDEGLARELTRVPRVLSVRPDRDEIARKKDYSYPNISLTDQLGADGRCSKFSPSAQNNEYWLVQMEKPGIEIVTKAQMVDYYAQTLTKVLGNEKDAQVSIYDISWEKDFGFCCQIDEECARGLANVPGVLAVRPDKNIGSDNKDYRGDEKSEGLVDSSGTNKIPDVKTKRLFVTVAKLFVAGLSFYTSEKTLRAAFEGFGELVEVKIIMDKISKRSKGYAFIEYTTEEAASAALKEMNGKIINGWMIVVDVAKTNPPKYSRARQKPPSASTLSY
ncbi:organelle RRM domain-containing protein 1, chloroplastic-like isoform X2 [Phoenix dactylifera]|uniref:Organelle RRM domain-containing protein 1, chloroplastic-like isoform X2 n=1 Tax=Phoenix dactylifera TaxID=42345 RepID=A0A8B8ZDT0_PHODC|nr:organelle RRM domain-containing protein 1, chloroplastic-like isoform X2 [Phoenix dactylifera]